MVCVAEELLPRIVGCGKRARWCSCPQHRQPSSRWTLGWSPHRLSDAGGVVLGISSGHSTVVSAGMKVNSGAVVSGS